MSDQNEEKDPLYYVLNPDKVVPNPDCGCSACNPNAWWMVVCATCGNKRCPAASNHIYACTNSNAPDQPKVLKSEMTPTTKPPEKTRQEFLDDAVAMAAKITEKDIASVINAINQRAKTESQKSDSYVSMFAASHEGLRGLLSETNDQISRVLRNTMDVLEAKGLLPAGRENYVMRNEVWYMLKLLPIMSLALEYDIDAREGYSCLKDKVRQIVYETFLDILKIKPDEKLKSLDI